MPFNRRHHDVEISVEAVNQLTARLMFRRRGEATQLTEPNRGIDGFAAALEDAFAGVVADIGVEEVDRDMTIEVDFEEQAENGQTENSHQRPEKDLR